MSIYSPKLEPFVIAAERVSPGGKYAIGLAVNGEVRAMCIGSGENSRDAKAAALRNVRALYRQLIELDPSNNTDSRSLQWGIGSPIARADAEVKRYIAGRTTCQTCEALSRTVMMDQAGSA